MANIYATITWQARQAGDGLKWEAVLIAPGVSSSKPAFDWTEPVLKASCSVFEGVDINAYEIADGFYGHVRPELLDIKQYLTSNKAATVRNVRYVAGIGVVGDIEFAPRYAWMSEALQKQPDFLGLSIDAQITAQQTDREPITPTRIVAASSVDIVTRPAAGGGFLRAVAGLEPEGNGMKKKLIEQIRAKRPDLLDGKDVDKLGDDEIIQLAQMAMEPKQGEGAGDAGKEPQRAAQGAGGNDPKPVTSDDLKTALAEMGKKSACGRLLDARMSESGLPELAQKRIRAQFENSIFETPALDAAVKAEKDYLASMSVPGFDMPDQGRASAGIGQAEKIQIAADMLFGIDRKGAEALAALRTTQGLQLFPSIRAVQAEYDSVPALSGIRELYTMLTGDTDVSGFYQTDRISKDIRAAQADFSTSSFATVLANTLNRRLVADYKAAVYHEDKIISVKKNVKDFRAQEAVMAGYLGDLDTVAKGGAYTEFDAITDEKSTYTVGKKGNILPFYREDIINDDVTFVSRMVARASRAARRTHAKAIWGPFINNANCSDGTAWFTAPHGNLGATAMSFATVLAAYKALAAMTEMASGEMIGWLDDPSVKPCLIYPAALMETGETIVNDETYYTGNDLTTKTRNPLKGKITGIQLSFLADANDWGLLMPPTVGDIVEVGYLNGREEPEVFLADNPKAGSVFDNDQIKYKIRHEYGVALVDYRTGYKAVVA